MSQINAWTELGKALGASEARPIGWWAGGLLLAGYTTVGKPELIITIDGYDLSQGRKTPSSINVKGLDLTYQLMSVNRIDTACFLIAPSASEYGEIFFALADYMLSKLPTINEENPKPSTLEKVIKDWVDFWSKEQVQGSREAIQGLVGELLALDRWVDLSGETYEVWQGPLGCPQDFRGGRDWLEIKTLGARTGPLVHTITSLDQLQNREFGKLYFLSLRIQINPTGQHSVGELVDRVRALSIFDSAEGTAHFESALESCGLAGDIPLNYSRFDL